MAAPSTRHIEPLLPSGSGQVNDSVTGVRALATAAGRAGTPKVSVTGVRATATAAGRAGSPKVSILGVRALATASGKAGTPKVRLDPGIRATATAAGREGTPKASILGVRALAKTGTFTASMPLAEVVTMTTNLNLGDGMVLISGKGLYANAATSPSSTTKWASPSTDLATYSTTTYPNISSAESLSVGMCYASSTNRIYQAFQGYDTGTRWKVRVAAINPDTMAYTTFVEADFGDSAVADSPRSPSIVTDDTYLYIASQTAAFSSTDCEIQKYLLSDGSLVGSRTVTGKTNIHPLAYDSATGKLFFGGTTPANHIWAGWMTTDMASHDTVELTTATAKANDDMVIVGDYFFLQDEDNRPCRAFRVHKNLGSFNAIDLGMGSTGFPNAMVYDATSGQIIVGVKDPTNGGRWVVIDPVSLTIHGPYTFSGGSVDSINEFQLDGSTMYISTYETTSKVARGTLSISYVNNPGTPKVQVTGTRALATAAGKPGTVTTESGNNKTIIGVRALATAAGRAGTPKVDVTGTRALASASGTAGTPKILVTGARALATASGKAGATTAVGDRSVIGVRALATATGKAGSPKISLLGVRALSTAAGRAGTPKITVSIRAEASAAGRAGTPKVQVTGARATATATGTAGTPKVSILGVRASASAAGRAGTPKILVTGARALATASGKAGSSAATGNKDVVGARASATAAGKPGTPKVSVTGTRSTSSAAGKPGTPAVRVTGTRALASATGKPGTVVKINLYLPGARASCTATGRAGTPKVAVTGSRATCTAAGRAGTPRVAVTGTRSACTAAGKAGTFRLWVTGTRAECTARGNGGFNGIPGLPVLTKRSRFSAPSASTILATRNGRTRVTLRTSSTRSHTFPTDD